MVKAVAVLDQTCAIGPVDRTLRPKPLDAHGTVTFSQEGNFVLTLVEGSLSGLQPGDVYALAVHQYGDITKGWVSTGPRFAHAGIAGVIAIFVAGPDGTATFKLEQKADLSGENSVMRRGLVVHGPIRGLNVPSGSIPGPEVAWNKHLDPIPGVAWAVIGLAR